MEHEVDARVADMIRRAGILEATYCNWSSKYGSLDENVTKRPKKLHVETLMEKAALKVVLLK